MKRTQEILGLPIISISDGLEAGKVKGVVVNAEKGAVDYVVVEGTTRVMGTWVIPADGILGIGEYALTIVSEDAIVEISKVPQAIELIQKDIGIKNTKVLTKKGRLIGETADFYVNEDDLCKISGLEFKAFSAKDTVRIIPRASVITFGKTLIVVEENVEESLLNDVPQYTAGSPDAAEEKKNLLNEIPNSPEEALEAVELIAATEVEVVPQDTDASSGGAGNLFEQKQRQYLIGRKATKTITDQSGNVIISDGMTIDDEVIDTAKQSGKLIELVMNNKA